MSELATTADDRNPAVLASRERAVSRVFRGMVSLYAGVGGMLAVLLTDVVGLSQTVQRVVQFGAAVLIWAGCVLIASATPHLLRFGRRLGALALASFAVAGICGFVAAAEMFASSFLGSNVLERWDEWAVRGAGLFGVLGASLMHVAGRKRGDSA